MLKKSVSIPFFAILLCLSLVFLLTALSPNWNTAGYRHNVNGVGYDTVNPPVKIDERTPKNIKNLTAILTAISRYENERYIFPISSDNGKGWSSPADEEGYRWIEGLAPKYINKIPEDASASDEFNYNFLYKSDGIEFKLIAHRPGDCEKVKKTYPQIVDAKRTCYAYGYWTEGAKNW